MVATIADLWQTPLPPGAVVFAVVALNVLSVVRIAGRFIWTTCYASGPGEYDPALSKGLSFSFGPKNKGLSLSESMRSIKSKDLGDSMRSTKSKTLSESTPST